ncbi:hypothetical protein UFOVP505_54 [uncultured Caudovirales phage]|uniref:Uncharacterized protein n=1 Tax=uncultured Caudovirales phage TaxID=2100421 RepID=A0A6J5MW16_9CAUD|nr:hypothetical protein UFOVP505_54 [uncultured Caudovirales phage]
MAQSYKFVINGTTRNLVSDYGLTVTQMLGGGMPQIDNVATEYALTSGAYFQRALAKPRIVTLVCLANGLTAQGLAAIRKAIIADIMANGLGTSFTLQYSPNSGTISDLSLTVRYAGGLEGVEVDTNIEVLAIRLLAVDPYWYAADGSPVSLTVNETATACSAHRRASLDWSSMTAAGAPTGTVPQNGIAVSADGTTVYVCQGTKLYRWVGGTWTSWTATGGGAAVNCVVAALTGSGCYVGGTFTAINGVAATNVASFDGTSTFATMGDPALGDITAIAISPSGIVIVGGNAGAQTVKGYAGGSWSSALFSFGSAGPISALRVASEATVGYPVLWIATTGYLLQRAYNGSSAAPAIAPSAGVINAIAIDAAGVVWVGGNYTLSGVTTYLAGWNGTAWVTPTGISAEVKSLSIDSSNVLRAGLATAPGVWRKIDGNVMIPDYGFRAYATVTAIGSASGADVQVVGQNTATASTWMYVGTLTNSGTVAEDITITLTVASGATAPTLYTIGNLTTGVFVQFNSTLVGPETITINTATNAITSSTRGSLKSEILNGVSISALKLAAGANSFGVLVYDPSSKVTATRTLLGFKYYSADAMST